MNGDLGTLGSEFLRQKKFLLGIWDNSLCLMSAVLLKGVLTLEAHQLLMLSVRTFTYLEPKLFFLIIFYNCTCQPLIISINCILYFRYT
jgi:hypothetical protein